MDTMPETKTRKPEARAAEPQAGPAPEPKKKSDQERLEGFEREQLRKMMWDMLLARRFEEKAAESYALGKIGGFCHLYIGQEAVAVGAIHALRPDDYVMTAYREHVHALPDGHRPRRGDGRAVRPRATAAAAARAARCTCSSAEQELPGRPRHRGRPDPAGAGRGVEDQVPQGRPGDAGVLRRGRGEPGRLPRGAEHGGAVEAAAGAASCENNRFGMGTAWERAAVAVRHLQKATAYAMPSAVADGMDVLDMYRVAKEAAERARAGEGPTLIEARTYRFVGHSMSDPVSGVYRTKEDVEKEKRQRPHPHLRRQLLAQQRHPDARRSWRRWTPR